MAIPEHAYRILTGSVANKRTTIVISLALTSPIILVCVIVFKLMALSIV